MSKASSRLMLCLALFQLLATVFVSGAFAQSPTPLAPGSIQVSRVQYDGNSFGNAGVYPTIFSDPTVTGIQGSIFIDQFTSFPLTPVVNTLPLPPNGSTFITTSFSSKSEGSLQLSQDGNWLTYMGYNGVDQIEGVSNSYDTDPTVQLSPNTPPNYDREVALIGANGLVSLTPESNAYSGDNPRGAITADGQEFYMAGNSDSTTYATSPVTGPGISIGARCDGGLTGTSYQLGTYFAADRPDESSKQHIKDNNYRAIGIFAGNLYVAKGSGGNGDDGVFQVQNGSADGLPSCTNGGTDTNNTIVELFGAPATNPTTKAASPYTPFGFFFANTTTLYVADEGYANLDGSGNLIPDPLAGLEKWSLVNGTWQLLYTITNGLNLYQPQTINGYPVPTYPTGIRNMAGSVNGDGTVTLYAITSQYSTISGGEPDPTSLVGITDTLAATTLPANEQFVTLQNSGTPEVFRGVAFIPNPNPRQSQTITFPLVGTLTFGVAPITLSATATSGWPIAYTLVSGPATLVGNVLTITGAGTIVVHADQSGNTDYTAAATVTQTITVNKATQTLTFTVPAPASAIYGSSFTVTAVASSGLPVAYTNGGSCTNVGPVYTMDSGIGECNVRASQNGNANYLAAAAVSEITLAAPATPTVTFTGAPSISPYGSTFTLIATTNASTAAVITATNPTACGLSGSSSPVTVTILKSAGTCIFKANWPADNNYIAATGDQVTVMEKAVSTISWGTPATITYGTPLDGTELNAAANVPGNFIYSPVAGAIVAAGTATLNTTFRPTNTNYSTATASVSLQVLQAPTTTTITSADAIVKRNPAGVASKVLDFNVTSFKPVGAVILTASTGEVCSGLVNAHTGNGSCKLVFTTTGTRTIIASYGGDPNHLASDSSSQTPPVTVTVN